MSVFVRGTQAGASAPGSPNLADPFQLCRFLTLIDVDCRSYSEALRLLESDRILALRVLIPSVGTLTILEIWSPWPPRAHSLAIGGSANGNQGMKMALVYRTSPNCGPSRELRQ
jgi:hypothetical protein